MLHDLPPERRMTVLDALVGAMSHWADGRGAPRIGEGLREALRSGGLDEAGSGSLCGWAERRSRRALASPPKFRVLDPMEQEWIDTQAYGYLLDLRRIGLLTPRQFDRVLMESSQSPAIPLSRDHVKYPVLKVLTQHFLNTGPTALH